MRAKLERNFGYDTKHAMHLVRLLRMAKEILAAACVEIVEEAWAEGGPGETEAVVAVRAGGESGRARDKPTP